jgi:hypothetical protein
MESLPVFVADWEMECCGRPFSVGTEVRWRVQFLYEDETPAPAEALLPLGSAVPAAVTAGLADPDEAEGLRGGLLATWHVGEPDAAARLLTGVVRRIRLVRQYTAPRDRVVTETPTGAQLTELSASRDRFARGSMRTPAESWSETGLLVDLTVDLADAIASVSG